MVWLRWQEVICVIKSKFSNFVLKLVNLEGVNPLQIFTRPTFSGGISARQNKRHRLMSKDEEIWLKYTDKLYLQQRVLNFYRR